MRKEIMYGSADLSPDINFNERNNKKESINMEDPVHDPTSLRKK